MFCRVPIPVAALLKAWVCGCSLASWDCGFESARGMDVCLLLVLCVVR
jgi:hypothetical protein